MLYLYFKWKFFLRFIRAVWYLRSFCPISMGWAVAKRIYPEESLGQYEKGWHQEWY